MLKYTVLENFFKSYVSVKRNAGFAELLNEFITEERIESVIALQQEIRALLGAGSEEEIIELFQSSGNTELRRGGQKYYSTKLIELYKDIQAKLDKADKSKLYDIFISYSDVDREKASRLAFDLIHKGYKVWFDKWEILAGHTIVDEVFSGILESEFLVVMLSTASCKSKWVQEELATAKLVEIEKRKVSVIPVILEPCDVPAALINKAHADFFKSWEGGLRYLTKSIDVLRMEKSLNKEAEEIEGQGKFDILTELERKVASEMEGVGFVPGTAYKEVLIGPPDGLGKVAEKNKLDSIVDGSRVSLLRWGGSAFPYEKDYESIERRPFRNGIRYFDSRVWPYSESSFHFWQIDDGLHFIHMSYIEEDQTLDMSKNKNFVNTLGYEWILMDIVRPIQFAHNLLNSLKQVASIKVIFIWGGLANRRLVVLSKSRIGFWPKNVCYEKEWRYQTKMSLDSDLLTEAREAVLDLFWLFNFGPDNLSTLNKDLETLIGGSAL